MPFANARPKSKHQAVKMNFYCEKLAHWMHPIEQYSTSSTKQCEQSHTAARCVHTNTPGPRFCMVCTTDKVSNMLRRYAKTTSRNEGWTTFANGWSCTVLHTRLILHNIIVNWLTWALGRKEPFGCGEYQVVFRVLCGGDAITDAGNNRTNQHQPGALIRTTVMKLMVWLWNVTILLLYIRSATAQWVLCVWEREREQERDDIRNGNVSNDSHAETNLNFFFFVIIALLLIAHCGGVRKTVIECTCCTNDTFLRAQRARTQQNEANSMWNSTDQHTHTHTLSVWLHQTQFRR